MVTGLCERQRAMHTCLPSKDMVTRKVRSDEVVSLGADFYCDSKDFN